MERVVVGNQETYQLLNVSDIANLESSKITDRHQGASEVSN